MYSSSSSLFILHPKNESATYLFFDNVHLLKNIRNNLYNAQKFVFPSFCFTIKDQIVASSNDGYISWSDLRDLYVKDSEVDANLRKAPKLTCSVLNPCQNKLNVNLALGLFHDTTIAAYKSFFPNREDLNGFLNLINQWWNVVNVKSRFHSNFMKSAVNINDGKLSFLLSFADWLERWSLNGCSKFCLSKQTNNWLSYILAP